jgi:hypothetical protein
LFNPRGLAFIKAAAFQQRFQFRADVREGREPERQLAWSQQGIGHEVTLSLNKRALKGGTRGSFPART